MQNNKEHIHLIIKVLSGDSSQDEQKKLNSWLSEDSDHRQIFDDYKKIWSLSHKEIIPEIERINLDDEWAKFKQKTDLKGAQYSIKPKKQNFSLLRIAAVILVFISLGITGIYLFGNKEQKIVANNAVKEVKLPDNTEVSVNKNSELIYDKKFNKKERHVNLNGEAFFKVAKNKEKPFIIHAESFYVEVLGTQFYVNSDYNDRQVIVKEGMVAVYSCKNKRNKIILHAGEKVVFNNNESTLHKTENFDANYLSWKTKIFNFQDASLEEIFAKLEQSYDIRFEFDNPALKNCRQTVSFENQTVDQILNVLKTAFDGISFREKGKTIYVNGKNCK